MSNSPPSPGPDLFFAGGECLTRFGVWVRRTDMDLEAATREEFTRNSDADAIGRAGILRTWEPDTPRAEWLNEADLDATRNLLALSENIGLSPWLPTRASVVDAGISAPDRETTAEKIVENTTAGNSHFTAQTIPQPPPDSDITFSVFVKAAERPGCTLIVSDEAVANGAQVNFPDVAGENIGLTDFGAGFAHVDQGSIPIGGGWFRLFMTVTTTGTEIRCRCSTNNGVSSVYDGDGVSGIFAWGAQCEIGLVLTDYQSTPRDTDRKSPALILEDAATNGWTQSEALDNAAWTKTACSIVPNSGVAPDDLTTADKIVEDSSNGQHRIERAAPATTDNENQALSFYAQRSERFWIRVQTVTKDNVNPASTFNIETGQPGIVAPEHTVRMTALPNEWFRIEVIYNIGTGGVGPSAIIGLADDTGEHSYQGDGTSGARVWGIQFEADRSVVSSYIRTVGVTETRAAETFSGPFPHPPQAVSIYSKWINEGRSVSRTSRIFHLGDSENNPRWILRETSQSGWSSQYDDGAGLLVTSSVSVQISMFPGDLVEALVTLDADGVLTFAAVEFNGDPDTALPGPPAQGGPLPAAWGVDPQLFIGSSGAANRTFARHLAHKAHRGIRTLDFMRAL